MKKRKLINVTAFVFGCIFATPLAAQTNNAGNDSTAINDSTHLLQEVTVEAASVHHKGDRLLYMPTAIQRRMADNGVTLLHAMQLPRIDVNPVENSIKTSGGESVQLRINGVEATTQELLAIQPKDVVRIEYHTMPGLRYGNVAAVLDYIVKLRDAGGEVMANMTNGLTMAGIGNYFVSGKTYCGKSSWSALGNWERRDLKWTRENYETFHLNDRTIETREIGKPTNVRYDNAFLQLGYSYANGDKSLLNITLRDRIDREPAGFENRDSRVYTEEGVNEISDHLSSRQNSPSLDIYYHVSLPHNQHLYLDLLGTYIGSRSERRFMSISEEDAATTVIASDTKGRKYSAIGEAIYEKMFKKIKLTAGLKHTQAYTNNRYSVPEGNNSLPDTDETRLSFRSAETYAFAELQQQIGQVGYTVGMGVMRTYNRQGREKQEKYIMRPSVTLTWQPATQLFLRLNSYVSAYSPSLASLSAVTQGIDTYQARRGNPALKTVTYCSNSLTVSWQSKPVSIDVYTRYSYDHHPTMGETLLEDNTIIRTEDNQRGFHRLCVDGNLRIRPFCNSTSELGKSVSITLTPFFNRYISQGNQYTHTHSNIGLRGGIMAMWHHWLMSADIKTSRHELWGENLKYEEATHTAVIGYRTQRWSANLIMINPFVKHYSQKQEDLSSFAPNRRLAYSDDVSRTLMLNVSINLNFGKQHKQTDKRINNDDTDAGILRGTK